MNNNQNYNGWILCPSKRFPGKFYYFNVLNGEAAWSLADTEKNFVDREDNIVEKTQCYPEPQSPPIAECHARNICYQHQRPNLNYSGKIFANKKSTSSEAVFGKVNFPKYVSNVVQCTPNIVWELNKISPTHDYMEDKATQTFLSKRDISTQTNGNSYCYFNKIGGKSTNLFFTTPSSINQHTQIFNQNMANFSTFRDKNEYNLTAQRVTNRAPIIRDSVLGIKQADQVFSQNMMKFSSSQDKNDCFLKAQRLTFQKPVINKVPENSLPTFQTLAKSVNNSLKPTFINFVKSSGSEINNRETNRYLIHESKATQNFNPKINALPSMFKMSEEKVTTVVDNHLSQNNTEKEDTNNVSTGTVDLRVMLNAKKRKISQGNNVTENTGGKKIKTSYEMPKTKTLKKHISFKDLDDNDRIVSDERINNEDSQDNSTLAQEVSKLPIMQRLKMLAKRTMRKDIWYITADTTVLLEDFEFISAFVERDETCRLLITRAVRSDIEALSSGESCGQQRVFDARQIARKLLNPPLHFVLQPPLENDYNNLFIDNMLNCCLCVIAENIHLVLITNDSKLLMKAKSLNIPCLKLQDIKDSIRVNFDINVISKTMENAQINTNDCQYYSNNSSEIPINVYKKVLFADRFQSKIISTEDDKYTDAEENDSIISDIGHDIELLGIEESKMQNPNKNTKEVTINKKQSETQNTFSFRTLFPQKAENLKHKKWPLTDKGTQTLSPSQNDIDNNNFDCNEIHKNIDENFNRKDKKNNNTSEHVKNNRLFHFQYHFANFHSTNHRLSDSDKIFLKEVSVKDYLEKFLIKYKVIEQKIKSGINEWLCFYRQIMEDVLLDVLQKRPPYISTPLTLLEAIERIGQKYSEHIILVAIIDKLNNIINPYVGENGNFKTDVEPSDFMCMFAYSLLLFKNLKIILPQCTELVEGEELLEAVLQKMEHQTPERVLPHSEEVINRVDTDIYKQNFTQKRELVHWEKHYSQCNQDEGMRDVDSCLPTQRYHNFNGNDQTRVFRTFGKNLDRLEINKNRSLTITNDGQKTKKDSNVKHNDDDKTFIGTENCEWKLDTKMRDVEQKVIRVFKDIKPLTQKLLNKIENGDNEVVLLKTNETKSHKLKANLGNNESAKNKNEKDSKELLNVDLDNLDSNNEVDNNMNAISNKDFNSDRDTLKDKDDKAISERKSIKDYVVNARDIIKPQNTGMNRDVLDDSTIDSGIDMEGTEAYSLGKLFMCEIATSFDKIYQFINESINELCDEKLTEARKSYFHKISNGLLKHLNGIIEKLKRITDRESNDDTSVKSWIMKAGYVASTDKHITNYRQVVKKCIEQAMYLQKALKLTLNVTDRNFECLSTADSESISESIQYLNIFE